MKKNRSFLSILTHNVYLRIVVSMISIAIITISIFYTASTQPEIKIWGGKDVQPGEMPWQVAIQRKVCASNGASEANKCSWVHQCGGSIINKRWVITAAHCFLNLRKKLDLNISIYRIFSGSVFLNKGGRHSAIKDIILKRYIIINNDNDVALILVDNSKLETKRWGKKDVIKLSNTISLIGKTKAVISGWGETKSDYISERLQKTDISIRSKRDCKTSYPKEITSNMFCASDLKGDKDSCFGDSGGPLITFTLGKKPRLTGIVSFGDACGKGGVYTHVAKYIPWINGTIENERVKK